MKNILYISGWLGAGRNSGTFRWLETAYPDCNIDCIAPGGTIDLTEMRKEMEKKINELNPLIVANSYGCSSPLSFRTNLQYGSIHVSIRVARYLR